MNRIFFQIFFTFWLITVAVVFSTATVSRYIDTLEKSEDPSAYELKKAALGILSRTAVIAESRSAKELDMWLYNLPRIRSVSAYIINISNPKLSTSVPDHVRKVAESLTTKNKTVEAKATTTTAVYGQLLTKNDNPIAKILIEAPLPSSPIVYFFTKYIWLRLLAAIIVSGLICYAMARAISRPIEALRKATQQLAEGNLESRFDEGQFTSDELKRLGSDFNYMAEHLQQTIEDQKQLVRDISHELRSPIGRIQAALALAQVKYGEDESELQRVEKECGRLNGMINQLLVMPNYSQAMDACIDLVALLHGIASDDELEAEQANKKIVVDTNLDELLVSTSGNLLWHAVDNLTRNALRHTPEGTTVTLYLRHDKSNQQIIISVKDQGEGVPEESLEKIFHPFYRVDQARGHDQDSHGLGLSIASRAVDHHKGTIRAKNTNEGFEIEIALSDKLITSYQ